LAPIPAAPAALAPAAAPERNTGPLNLGFLTVIQEANGYLGGYLVTNTWGRPLEFRLSSAVQPNRVQQILYANTLQPYLFADLIGKTLVDKAGVAVQLVVTDREPVLGLRLKLEVPVVWLANGRETWSCHPRYPGDAAMARELLGRLDSTFDLAEPFQRIREAVGEARKLGVANR
jgi:hypothetical protein